MQQVLVANKLIKPVTKDGKGPFEVKSAQRTDTPRGGLKGKQVESYYIETESQSDSKYAASGNGCPEEVHPPKFTLYDGKSDPTSHISHFRQVMALWTYLAALICKAGHLKEYVEREKTKAEEAEVRPNPSLAMNEVLLVQPKAKKPRQGLFEPGSITFTKVNLKWVQHPHSDPLAIQLWVHNYDVKRILVDTGSSVEVEEELEILEGIGRNPKAKVAEDLVRYDLDEPSSDYFFLICSNLKERNRTELIEFLTTNI
ncbi:hypothetical protein Acr_00g0031320 [Actinidia rufa]|uniref:Uncharacterized protein n=1 Tax=Actinidia rufa TaxID=165716 RepID=A0A7J0DGB1_9ERIC|nr:hypothetical protein Acr_00g0031320 [Actinidia rufa]